jgi:hypothetical protein
MLGQGEFFMKRVIQIFAFTLLLSLTGAANGMAASIANTEEWQKQDKPPERPKEREKPKDEKRSDPPKNDKKKPDDR